MPNRREILKSTLAASALAQTAFTGQSITGIATSLSTAIAGLALAVRPSNAQTIANMIVTNSNNLSTGNGETASKVPFYFAKPEKAQKTSLVIVVSEIFGVHEYIRDVCRRLAHLGYLAIAPDLFKRQGNPQKLSEIKDILEKIVAKTPDNEVMTDLDDIVQWAKENENCEKVGITGFCWGGRITWLYAAHNPAVNAGVAWYGRLNGLTNANNPSYPLDIVDNLKAPVLGLYGGIDQGIPLEDVEEMSEKLKKSSNIHAVSSKIEVYDNSSHAFHADYRPSYRKEDAEAAWEELKKWFAAKL